MRFDHYRLTSPARTITDKVLGCSCLQGACSLMALRDSIGGDVSQAWGIDEAFFQVGFNTPAALQESGQLTPCQCYVHQCAEVNSSDSLTGLGWAWDRTSDSSESKS